MNGFSLHIEPPSYSRAVIVLRHFSKVVINMLLLLSLLLLLQSLSRNEINITDERCIQFLINSVHIRD